MARRSGRPSDFNWQGLLGIKFALSAGTTALAQVNNPQTASTLMRSRGEVQASIDGPVDGDAVVASVGLIVVTEEQLAVGVTAVPNPADDLDAEWIWHGFILLQAQAGTAVGASLNVGQVAGRLSVDSKAMRRMKQGQSVVFVGDNNALAGSPAIDIMGAFRQLFAV